MKKHWEIAKPTAHHSYQLPSIHPTISTEPLLCARHYSRHENTVINKTDKDPAFLELIVEEKTDN